MADNPTNTQLEIAELYALDLDADTGEQIRLLKQLHKDLALRLAVGEGAISVARERFEAAARATESLLGHVRVHRELLNDLRASLRQLRSSLKAIGELSDQGFTARKPDEPAD